MKKSRVLIAIFAILAATVCSAGSHVWTASGPEGGYGDFLEYDQGNPSIVFAGSAAGLFRSVDAGASWSIVPGFVGRRVISLAVSAADPAVVYAGGLSGLYRSSDHGLTFSRVSIDVYYHLVVSQVNANVLFRASSTVEKSTDGGATWTPAGNGLPQLNVSDLTISASDPNVVYVSAHGGSIVYRTGDGGGLWTLRSGGLTKTVLALAVDPTNSSIAYAGEQSGVVQKTVDGGVSWSPVATGLSNANHQCFAVSRSAPGTLLVGTNGGTFRTTNGGSSWQALTGGGGGFTVEVAISPSSAAALLVSANETIYRSTNSGATMVASDAGFQAVSVGVLAASPTSPHTLYAAGSSGFYRSTDDGATWSDGAYKYVNDIAPHPSLPGVVYIALSLGVYRSTDGGVTFSPFIDGLNGEGTYSVAIDAAGTLYTATSSAVYRSVAGGAWTVASTGIPASSPVYFLRAPQSTSGVAYAGGGGAVLFKTVNGGATWFPAADGITSAIFDVKIDPFDPQHLIALTYGGAYQSFDGAASWIALNGASIDALSFDPVRRGVVYRAGGYGTKRSHDDGRTWITMDSGLGDVTLRSLVMSSDGATLHGSPNESVWSYSFNPRVRVIRR